jgi:putative ATP-binding cassette transporter
MKLIQFFSSESDAPKGKILAAAAVSGIANGLLLGLINTAAENTGRDYDEQARFFFLFLFSLLLFVITKKYALSQATIAVEQAIRRVRLRIVDKIRHTELRFVENVGRSHIFTRLTQDANLISQAATILINAAQSAIVLIACLLYIAWMSLTGFFITVGCLSIAVIIYLSNYNKISSQLRVAVRQETEFFDGIHHTLDGFKEIKVNQKKSNALFGHIEEVSIATENLKTEVGVKFIMDFMFAQVSFYILIAIIIFILPVLSQTFVDDVVKITIAILFLFSPLDMLVSAIPVFARANVAVSNIEQLEAEIDSVRSGKRDDEADLFPLSFDKIELLELAFEYKDEDGYPLFSVGPLSLTIQRGELLFIVGGNGSGKSTLLKLLTALYPPSSGLIKIDNVALNLKLMQSYRELFSLIFTDFHLFDRLYGLDQVDPVVIANLIKTMQLHDKTRYIDGRFTNINLSTGQRKRLAYIASLLDNKEIYVFDEWAADQDPEFRKNFYESLLPELQRRGKTIIAVTHDDKYFHLADRIMKMEYGKMVEVLDRQNIKL